MVKPVPQDSPLVKISNSRSPRKSKIQAKITQIVKLIHPKVTKMEKTRTTKKSNNSSRNKPVIMPTKYIQTILRFKKKKYPATQESSEATNSTENNKEEEKLPYFQ